MYLVNDAFLSSKTANNFYVFDFTSQDLFWHSCVISFEEAFKHHLENDSQMIKYLANYWSRVFDKAKEFSTICLPRYLKTHKDDYVDNSFIAVLELPFGNYETDYYIVGQHEGNCSMLCPDFKYNEAVKLCEFFRWSYSSTTLFSIHDVKIKKLKLA